MEIDLLNFIENNMYKIKSKQDDIYFKIHCLYNAKTEMYDRTLTDRRDRYDPTSAYVNYSYEVRSASNHYAYDLYLWCRKKIVQETRRPFDVHKWRESIREYWNLSAQGWIDLYEYFVENGEFNRFRKE